MGILELETPLKEGEVRKLVINDLVYISGLVFTGRSGVHIRLIEENVPLPIDFSKINVMWHLGPVMKKEKDELRSNQFPKKEFNQTNFLQKKKYHVGVIHFLPKDTLDITTNDVIIKSRMPIDPNGNSGTTMKTELA